MSRRTHLVQPTTHYRSRAVTVQAPDPRLWKVALKLAKGDAHRLTVEPDGSVIVHNHPKEH